jgi:GNAT superfamily N-acetyltransferase
MILRPATASDADALTALTRRSKAHWGYSAEFMAAIWNNLVISVAQIEADGCVVACTEDVVLGYYRIGGPPPTGLLMDLFVDPQAIGTGIGRALWEHATNAGRERGYQTLNLESDPNAEGFYLRMGARRVGEREVSPNRLLPLMSADL